jgi:DNA-binding transcriptional MerR regulator
MLKIRDFARLAEVSMTTLRYYDEIGLLKPVYVDPETGYRFYATDQLPRLHRILAFKDLGLGLTQIVEIFNEDISSDQLQGMLRLRQAQLQQQVQVEQEQLARIEARLRSLERSTCLPVYEVVLKAVKPIIGVSLRPTVADLRDHAHWRDVITPFLQRYKVTPVDHLLVLHIEGEDDYPSNFHAESEQVRILRSVEIIAPVDARDADMLVTRSEGRLQRCMLPAFPHVASILHRGHPSLVLPAYQALGSWIENNAYTITGPRRKVFLHYDQHLDDALTEIQFPVEKMNE